MPVFANGTNSYIMRTFFFFWFWALTEIAHQDDLVLIYKHYCNTFDAAALGKLITNWQFCLFSFTCCNYFSLSLICCLCNYLFYLQAAHLCEEEWLAWVLVQHAGDVVALSRQPQVSQLLQAVHASAAASALLLHALNTRGGEHLSQVFNPLRTKFFFFCFSGHNLI